MNGENLRTTKVLQESSNDLELSQREKHLIGLAVTLTRGCDACTNRRFKEAMGFGISQQELIDLTDLVALTNAGVVARTALKSWDDELSNTCQNNLCQIH